MADANRVTVDLTTGIGTLSFPHLFLSTAAKKDDGTASYEVQIIIPKTQRDDLRAILAAIKKVGEAKWGDNWKKVRSPLRDGDKEQGDLTEDGSTKGAKYPERLGAYFINARSTKPVGVFDRQRNPINDPNEVYGGCKAKINVTFYPYATNGNTGIAAGLNGVQKIADGESFGGGAPAVESMFDTLEDSDDDGLDLDEAEVEETPAPAKKAPAKKVVEVVVEDDDLADLEADEEEDDLYDDLDD